jgi:glutaredoxin 3
MMTAANVKLYVTTYCSYCKSAKSLLQHKGVAFEEIDCTENPQTRRWLVEQTGRRTVPQLFVGDVPVGGFDDLQALNETGDLDKILAGELAPTPL